MMLKLAQPLVHRPDVQLCHIVSQYWFHIVDCHEDFVIFVLGCTWQPDVDTTSIQVLTVYAVRRMRRGRRVFLSRRPTLRPLLRMKDVIADGWLGGRCARCRDGCVFSLTSVPGPRKLRFLLVDLLIIFIFAKADALHGKDCWPSKSLVWFQSVVTCVVQRLETSLSQRPWLWCPFGYWMWGAIWL